MVEVIDRLRGLEGRIGIPDASRFVADLLGGVGVGGIRRHDVLD
jgi:hypothetical protein